MRKLSSVEYKNLPETQSVIAQLKNLRSLEINDDLSSPIDFSEFQQRFETVSQIGMSKMSIWNFNDRAKFIHLALILAL